MARTPNYSFEKRERERRKAEKKARRAKEKQEARENKSRQTTAPDDAAIGSEDLTPDGTQKT